MKGYNWSFYDGIVNAFFTGISAIVLARLLDPHDFGLMGMLAVFIAVSNGFVNSGFFITLIRKKNADNLDFNTVFVFNILIGFIAYIILLLLSPQISNFYQELELKAILPVLALIIVINSLGIIQLVQLTKSIKFQQLFYCTLISNFISLSLSILLAYYGYGVWAIVYGQLTKQLLNTVAMWWFNKWMPSFSFSITRFKDLLAQSSYFFVAGTINNITSTSFQGMIGKFSNTANAGYYNRADQFSTIVSSNLTSIISRVSLPNLSDLQNEKQKFENYYMQLIKYNAIVISAVMILILLNSGLIVYVLLGSKWLPIVPIMKILCLNGIIYSINSVVQSPTQICGSPKALLLLEIIRAILILPIAIILINLNIYLGVSSVLIGNFLVVIIYIYYNNRKYGFSIIAQVKKSMTLVLLNLPIIVFGIFLENEKMDFLTISAVVTFIFLLYNSILLKFLYNLNFRNLLNIRRIMNG